MLPGATGPRLHSTFAGPRAQHQISGRVQLVDLHEATPYKPRNPENMGMLPAATAALDNCLFAPGNGVVT